MRSKIKRISIGFENLSSLAYFYNALRYSTHCKYVFFHNFKFKASSEHSYIEFSELTTSTKLDYYVDIDGRIYRPSQADPKKALQEPVSSSKYIKHYYFNGIINKYNYLFSCDLVNDEIHRIYLSKRHINFTPTNGCESPPDLLLAVDETSQGIAVRSASALDTSIFETAQLFGINIALLIVQEHLKRSFITNKFVDDKYIDLKEKCIFLKNETFYFDLDETLIWDDQEISITKKLLFEVKKRGSIVILITRHKLDLKNTLSKIGLKENDFNHIYLVKDNEKKSSFVNAGSIFIDNEFPERLDVRRNSGATVLDIDVLHRVKIYD